MPKAARRPAATAACRIAAAAARTASALWLRPARTPPSDEPAMPLRVARVLSQAHFDCAEDRRSDHPDETAHPRDFSPAHRFASEACDIPGANNGAAIR